MQWAFKSAIFLMQLQSMYQNNFLLDAINRETIISQTDTHHHNCLSSYGIISKTT